jgi:hypothetical protein
VQALHPVVFDPHPKSLALRSNGAAQNALTFGTSLHSAKHRTTRERSKLAHVEDPIFKQFAAEYARHIVGQCRGDPALLADQIAALIGILECAAKGAWKVGNEDVASLTVDGSALLREAALHLPVKSPFLLYVLKGEPPPPLGLDTFQTLFAT